MQKTTLLLGVALAALLHADARAAINDPGFDNPNIGTNSAAYGFQFTAAQTASSPWTFSGYSGVANGTNAFASPTASGGQVAFLQYYNSPNGAGTISQTFTQAAGNYQLTLQAATRPGYGASSFSVTIDNTTYTVSPPSTSLMTVTENFTLTTSGNHTITFGALSGAAGGDSTTFIDNVSLSAVPTPGSLTLLGIGVVASTGVAARRSRRTK